MKLNSSTTYFKSFCFVIVLLWHTEVSTKLVFLSSFSYFERIDKISKIDKIDTMDWKIDKYQLLTTFFYRFSASIPDKINRFLSILSDIMDYRLIRPGLLVLQLV